MANWRYKARTRPNAYNPRARAVCDRCACEVQHYSLIWEMEYRGNSLMKTGFLVCPRCLDVPYQGRRPIIIPADPVPIQNPRTEPLLQEEGAGAQTNPALGYWDQGGLNWDNGVTVWAP